MENFASLVPLVILIPFAGMLLNLFLGKNMGEKMIGLVACTAAGLAFAIALIMCLAASRFGYEGVVINPPLLSGWISIPAAAVEIPWQFRVDTLSLTMMLVVTGVGTLIHIYAVGYMHGDARFARFFVYMNLFLGFMLILVTGNNFLVAFVGWEGVGLCSFLLIGFWFDKKRGEGWRNSNAARKAFIVNRVGDFGFMLAILLTFWTFGTLDFYKPGEVLAIEAGKPGEVKAAEGEAGKEAAAQTGSAEKGVFGKAEEWLKAGGHVVNFGNVSVPFENAVTIITLLMLIGVTGKSAQIPLFVWLPDAMAGPTPVSALIHAATMVTAGIYLITRNSVLFHAAPLSSALVTLVGSGTALMAGFIALGQWDIKRVLAYSTVSQLGFMVAGVGLGGYAAGMFHLVTHAFFKALLFLGSGSVIHGVEHGHHHAQGQHGAESHDEHHEEEETPFDPQDMRNMGGLRSKMPLTFWLYLIGTLALAGIFPLAGFWSKDEILGKALNAGFNDGRIEGYIALALLITAAGFTAFYMWRQVAMIFLGAPRTEAAASASESGWLMTGPLVVLAALSIFGGLLNVPEGVNIFGWKQDILSEWLEHSVPHVQVLPFNVLLAGTALGIAVVAILAAHRMYVPQPLTKKGHDRLEGNLNTRQLFRWANAKLYWDETYGRFIEQPFNRASVWLANTLDWKWWHDGFHNRILRDNFNRAANFLGKPVDRGAIDQGFLSLARGVEQIAARLRRIQTGDVRTYAFTMLIGVLLILLLILLPLLPRLVGQ